MKTHQKVQSPRSCRRKALWVIVNILWLTVGSALFIGVFTILQSIVYAVKPAFAVLVSTPVMVVFIIGGNLSALVLNAYRKRGSKVLLLLFGIIEVVTASMCFYVALLVYRGQL